MCWMKIRLVLLGLSRPSVPGLVIIPQERAKHLTLHRSRNDSSNAFAPAISTAGSCWWWAAAAAAAVADLFYFFRLSYYTHIYTQLYI